MSEANGHAVPAATHHLVLHPVRRDPEVSLLGAEWSSDDPDEVTYVSVGRAAYTERVATVRAKLKQYGITVLGPLVPDEEDAAKKSQHNTWRLSVPEGQERNAVSVVRSVGAVVGPVRSETAQILQEDADITSIGSNGKSRMRIPWKATTTSTAAMKIA